MKKLWITFFVSVFCLATTFAQQNNTTKSTNNNNLSISVSTNPDTLVAGFIEYGVTISNVSYTGAGVSLGSFICDTLGALQMNKGIVLSSGRVVDAQGPNNSQSTSSSSGGPGDPDLAQLSSHIILDAAVLEFDLIPENNFLAFNFVFGSEEYPEFANSSFNDVFGFFITGPDPAGGQYNSKNIALIPGTDQYISIANINNGINFNGPCVNCEYLINNTGGPELEYDAYTTLIPVSVFVVPGQQYHLKIAIGDCSDRLFDSGIFLQSPSLKSYTVVGIPESEKLDEAFIIPNPAGNNGRLQLQTASGMHIKAELIDITGRTVTTISDEYMPAGNHSFHLKNTDLEGLYFERLQTGENTQVLKVIF